MRFIGFPPFGEAEGREDGGVSICKSARGGMYLYLRLELIIIALLVGTGAMIAGAGITSFVFSLRLATSCVAEPAETAPVNYRLSPMQSIDTNHHEMFLEFVLRYLLHYKAGKIPVSLYVSLCKFNQHTC
jgi:hypothetical protein